ncbi:hypothetical protein LTR95_007240 [Oleoguttula sp. CCFEE 5521]
MAAVAMADVRVYTDESCHNDELTVRTSAGNCYTLPGGINSAGGCSVGHNLRIFSDTGCGGSSETVSPQKCVNFGNKNIRSIKCPK